MMFKRGRGSKEIGVFGVGKEKGLSCNPADRRRVGEGKIKAQGKREAIEQPGNGQSWLFAIDSCRIPFSCL